MRFTLILGLLAALITPAMAGDVTVRGYTRSDGTYVAPYHRTSPDSTINNNYSTRPNINPYTGQEGTKAPDYTKPLSPSPYSAAP